MCCRLYAAAGGALRDDDGRALNDLDSVVVVGGGLNGDGSLPPWVQSRLEAAATVAKALSVPLLVSGGWTPHRPALVLEGRVLLEADVCTSWLVARGMLPAKQLLKETQSCDTVGNAWFSYTMHARPARWCRTLVVTSAFHMPRVRTAFSWIFGLDENGPQVQFLSSEDTGIPASVLEARSEKERESLHALEANARRYRDVAAVHAWLNATHLCYAVARQAEKPAELPASLRASY